MKKTLLLMLILFAGNVVAQQRESDLQNSSWFAEVQKSIKQEEYNISYSEKAGKWQSPNRAQNLRFYYDVNGFTAQPRQTKIPMFDINERALKEAEKQYQTIEDFKIAIYLKDYGRKNNQTNFNGKEIKVTRNTAEIEDEGLKIRYTNTEEGMRQDFIVKERPAGEGKLEVRLRVTTDLHIRVGAEALAFVTASSEEKMKYSKLKVWDASGKVLHAYFEKRGKEEVAIVVADADAEYPVTIDPISSTASWTAESNQTDAYFGYSVSTAGDVNGDGYSDVIVGAYGYDNGQNSEGRAYVYYGSASGLNSTANWTAESNQAGATFGWSVSTAGDVNGDGYSDVIVGAPYYTNGESNEGGVFVYHGSASGLSTTANRTLESNKSGAGFGYSVSIAGDVNGDSYSDVIVGAPYYTNGESNEGGVFVYHGSASGLSTTANRTVESNQASANFGTSVSTAGDVNGDGYSDVIVGAPYYDNGESNEGRAYVYHGSTSGVSATANWTTEGGQAEANYGTSVSTAGDVNGDGYSDVIVGAPYYDNGESNEGRVYVYHGSASGVSATANWTTEGGQAEANYGTSVATAGDVNGDGYSDVLVGAPYYDNGETDEGLIFGFYGSAVGLPNVAGITNGWSTQSDQTSSNFGISVATAGDVNGDGYSDVIVGAFGYDNGQLQEGRAFVYHGSAMGLSTSPNWTAESNQADAWFGESVATAGDVNGDGYSDVIVGSSGYDNGQTDEGRAFVYHGSASGLSTSANWIGESNQASAKYGISVATAGDVNGDGYSDVIVGSWCYDNGQSDEGSAFVYHGSVSGLSATANWTSESDQASANFGASVSTAGDVNGDGYSDVIVGAPYYDNEQTNEGRVFVYYGNARRGVRSTLQQYQVSSTNIIGPHGSVTTDGQIRFSQYAKSPFGRAKGKLVYEYKETGTPFSGSPITNSVSSSGMQSSFTNLGTSGTNLNIDVSGIPTFDNYRWRVRVMYDKVSNPYQVYGPWRYYESYQPLSFGSFKSQNAPLPVELSTFTARLDKLNGQNVVVLGWQTATEINSYGFEIERRKVNGEQWQKVGFVEGSGTSNAPKEYTYTDSRLSAGRYEYRLKQIDLDGSFKYSQSVEIEIEAPREFALLQNYPNPFNPSTTIRYDIPNVGTRFIVSLKVYDILGKEVATLVNEQKEAGSYEVQFDASKLSSGVYFYKLQAGNYTAVRKLLLVK